MSDKELLEQALEALSRSDYLGWQLNIPIIKSLRERLAQPDGKQLNAYKLLVKSLEEQLSYHRSQAEKYREAIATLQSERQANAVLTEEVERLAQPEQEPVAWADMDVRGEDKGLSWTPGHFHKTPLYTTPPQRKPLTHPQIHEFDWPDGVSFEDILPFVRAIEAAHGIKGEA